MVGDYGNGNELSYEFSHKRGSNELVFPIFRKINIPFRLVLIGITRQQDIRIIREYFAEMDHIELIIPVLAIDVGENANFILPGINGFLCNSLDDYYRHIKQFIDLDRNMYFEMSKNAYSQSQLFRTGKYCENLMNYFQAFPGSQRPMK